MVRRSPWEPRSQNAPANRAMPPTTFRVGYIHGTNYSGTLDTLSAKARAMTDRVNGQFTGTTDEIIQWAAFKWGFDEEIIRAVCHLESQWFQVPQGPEGMGSGDPGGGPGGIGPHYSYGITSIKTGPVGDRNDAKGMHWRAWPWAKDSTAFNLDYYLGWRRLLFEGEFSSWMAASFVGDEWGGVGAWYLPTDPAGITSYNNLVRVRLAQQPWRAWAAGFPEPPG